MGSAHRPKGVLDIRGSSVDDRPGEPTSPHRVATFQDPTLQLPSPTVGGLQGGDFRRSVPSWRAHAGRQRGPLEDAHPRSRGELRDLEGSWSLRRECWAEGSGRPEPCLVGLGLAQRGLGFSAWGSRARPRCHVAATYWWWRLRATLVLPGAACDACALGRRCPWLPSARPSSCSVPTRRLSVLPAVAVKVAGSLCTEAFCL